MAKNFITGRESEGLKNLWGIMPSSVGESNQAIADAKQQLANNGAKTDTVTGELMSDSGRDITTSAANDGTTSYYTPNKGTVSTNEPGRVIHDIEQTNKDSLKNYSAPDAYNTFDFTSSLNSLKERQSHVDDYYKDSMSSMWKNLSDEDKRILLFDQLGNSLKKAGRYRPRMYGAFGNVIDEGSVPEDQESMLQKGLSESFQKGLERRNERLDNQMQEQLKLANFPSELNMKMTELWENLKTNNKAKAHLISILSDVRWLDALKAGMINISSNGSIYNAAGQMLGSLL